MGTKARLGMLHVCGGEQHTLFLSEEDRVFGCGASRFGQLGIGDKASDEGEVLPVEIHFPVKIVQVAAGFYFSACLGENGSVFTFGENEYGQLGLGDFVPRFEPVCVPSLSDISFITCRNAQAYCLNSSGEPFSFGLNSNGQLGIGSLENANLPQKVSLSQCVTQISAGYQHAVFLTNSGSIFTCGVLDQ